ncbi:hypothetical protein [Clostridium estertheticum]|nr:hypothetical protein [Clostridium estertheticum]
MEKPVVNNYQISNLKGDKLDDKSPLATFISNYSKSIPTIFEAS